MDAFFALTTRGLEHLSAEEIASLPGVTVHELDYRRISGSCPRLEALLSLKTVDDVFLQLATWTEIGRQRSALQRIEKEVSALDLERAVQRLRSVRAIPTPVPYSVSASFVGRRNFTSGEIKQAVRRGLRSDPRFEYVQDDRRAAVCIRFFLHQTRAEVGLRVAKAPLHERDYKQQHLGGALKPSLAAAMLRLVQLQEGERLVDPCCGTGTIAIEAARAGAVVRAGDLDPAAVAAARENAQLAGVECELEQWDARRLPVTDGSSGLVVSNLPWGRQVSVDSALADFYRDVCGEIARILVPGGRAALLTANPELLDAVPLALRERREVSLFGQTPCISVYLAPAAAGNAGPAKDGDRWA